MRVAIYARYSSENQSEKSIDDQIRVCKNYIKNNDMMRNTKVRIGCTGGERGI